MITIFVIPVIFPLANCCGKFLKEPKVIVNPIIEKGAFFDKTVVKGYQKGAIIQLSWPRQPCVSQYLIEQRDGLKEPIAGTPILGMYKDPHLVDTTKKPMPDTVIYDYQVPAQPNKYKVLVTGKTPCGKGKSAEYQYEVSKSGGNPGFGQIQQNPVYSDNEAQ